MSEEPFDTLLRLRNQNRAKIDKVQKELKVVQTILGLLVLIVVLLLLMLLARCRIMVFRFADVVLKLYFLVYL